MNLKLAACEQRGNGQPGEAKQRFPENKKKPQSKPHNPILPGEDDDREFDVAKETLRRKAGRHSPGARRGWPFFDQTIIH